MCVMCDGWSWEEFRQQLQRWIDESGFALIPVTGSVPGFGWTYTIGLFDTFDHPELVAVAGRITNQADVLHALAQCVRDGERFKAGDTRALHGGEVGFVDVHPAHVARGLVDAWFRFHHETMRSTDRPTVLQVILAAEHRCHEHQETQPRLDNPSPASFSLNHSWRKPKRMGKLRG
jgi:hypothetical protein